MIEGLSDLSSTPMVEGLFDAEPAISNGAGSSRARGGYDPEMRGAFCSRCPLNQKRVVPPEMRASAELLVIGEAPGQDEESEGAPFVGRSGRELERALSACGERRQSVSITNVLLCRPPGNRLRRVLAQVKRQNQTIRSENKTIRTENRNRKKQGLDLLAERELVLSPVKACRPRLMREVEAAKALLLLGKPAYEAIMKERLSKDALSGMRGFPLYRNREDGSSQKVMTTYHPAFVLRSRRWTETLRSDVAKAFRFVRDELEWEKPTILWDPSERELRKLLEQWQASKTLVAVDTETWHPSVRLALDPELAHLRCIQLGSASEAIVLWYESCEQLRRTPKCLPDVWQPLVANFLRMHKRLCGHNLGLYDRPILERYRMPLRAGKGGRIDCVETLIAHHVTDPELPHKLDYLMSRHTDAPKHKGVNHDKWDSDRELGVYGAMDVVGTARLAPMLAQRMVRNNHLKSYAVDMDKQWLCLGMHRSGMAVDQAERERHRLRLDKAKHAAQERVYRVLERSDLNIGSHEQVRELLYSEFGLRPPDERETQSGEPPVDKDALHELLSRPLPENVVELLEGLLAYRRAEKMLSTYVVGSEKKPLYFDPLGRVHPTWSPHSARTGRLSAQNPAVQTIPATKLDTDSLRSMYIAGPGNVLVYADMAQIEARLITLFAQDEVWGRAFKEKRDIHRLNAVTFFNSAKTPLKYEQIDKGDYRRDFAKTLVYMYSYGGGALRAMKNMRLVRDPRTGERKYARFSLRESKAARRALLRDHPALEKWWDETMEEFRLKGELRGLIHDRASYFLDCEAGNADEEDRSQIVNFRIQCTAAAIVDEWCRLLMEEIGWSWYGKLRGLGGPGICFQGHDSVMLEVKANQAERAKILLEETSKRVLEWRGMKMDFFAELKVGQRWSILG